MLDGKKLLLIISGGIAAYKCLDLVRRLKERGMTVRVVMTRAATQFVTPLSLSALTEEPVCQDLFSLTDEAQMGHIRLSREADLVLVAPASADILARMAAGMADDLATTVLLATDKPVITAPAMNVFMWNHAATRHNLSLLHDRGIRRIGPDTGDLACGEQGGGRMAEPVQILAAIEDFFAEREVAKPLTGKPLTGKRALVTSGPTHEPIDPVRFIANRSSGKQGHAVAAALAAAGAEVTLISGPVSLPDPEGCHVVATETAVGMHRASLAALPVDIAVCAAAVADWRVNETAEGKIKKTAGHGPPSLQLVENPDILQEISARNPRLVVGFAAETGDVIERAKAKLRRKGCDWIVANDVSTGTGVFGGDDNKVHLITKDGTVESWACMSKHDVAGALVARIAETLGEHP